MQPTFTHTSFSPVYSYQDPFEDYKKRLAKKLAKRAEGDKLGAAPAQEKPKDEVNWFGVKVGSQNPVMEVGDSGGGGVGKYLNLKRPAQEAITSSGGAGAGEDAKKKRKIGFGDFEGW